MKRLKIKDIPKDTKAILYLCDFNREHLSISVMYSKCFEDVTQGLHYYSEIRDPGSQLVIDINYDKLIHKLELLHKNMNDKKWLEMFYDAL